VKAVKKDGIVYAELAEPPEKVRFNIERKKRMETVDSKKMKEVVKKENSEKEIKESREDKENKEET
jgi:hypothetical protein